MTDADLLTKVKDPPSEHPYQKYVKPILASRLKYSHNSIYANPVYPVKVPKQRRNQGEREKFTIYGIRSIPEFNYCVQIAQGLHRCRPYLFDAPEIQAITCVDWPKVWTDLKVRFGGIVYCIQSSVVILTNGNLLGGKPEFEQYIKTRYNYYLCLDYYKLAVDSFIRFVRSSGKPHAYMHIAIDDEMIGTFIFRLYSDILPSTCDNFLRLCNATRGGYGGTPVHRIVKDNWIQCGGYGLKNNPNLGCENFIVPHDKRGVLGMANDGRNCDCSTQFFILLQPSPWMACKYVAFGQLIDGEQTLEKIEKAPTFYESPLSNIVIAKAGILNLEATDVVINPGTTEYINGHIEDLVTLGGVALGWLMQRLDLEIQMIEVSKLMAQGEGGDDLTNEGATAEVRNAERFLRAKGKDQVAEAEWREEQVPSEGAKNEEEYEYVYEEEVIYMQVTPPASVDARPSRPYYIPLTDVPYPGEKDSTYDLKKFLAGDYCLGSDLGPNTSPRKALRFHPSHVEHDEEATPELQDESPEVSVYSMDSDDRSEIRRYIRDNSDHVSFAGGIVSKIASGYKEFVNIFDEPRRVDESTTKARLARRVSLAVPVVDENPEHKVKRRQTGFVKLSTSEMEQISASEMVKLALGLRESGDGQSRHVRIADAERRLTLDCLASPKQRLSDEAAIAGGGGAATGGGERPPSVMKRLYADATLSDDATAPTLKNYRPINEPRGTGLMLTHTTHQLHLEDSMKSKIHHTTITQESLSLEKMLTLQHGKRMARKFSSDYVKTIDQFEQPVAVSLRSLEYAKTRPSLSVAEYQARNDAYDEGLRRAREMEVAALARVKAKVTETGDKLGKRQSRGRIRESHERCTIDQFEQPVAVSLRSLEYAKTRLSVSVAEYQAWNDAYDEGLKRAREMELAKLARAEAKAAASSVKLETKMEIPEMFTATTASVLGEEERLGENSDEDGHFEDKLAASLRDQLQVISTYEKTTETEVTVEHKTVKTYMDPPPAFNTRSSTSTNAIDERDELTSGGNGPGGDDDSIVVSADSLKH